MTEMTRHVLISFFFICGNDVISLESRPLNFRVTIQAATPDVIPVFANTRTKSVEKHFVEHDVKSNILKYSTVDKIN